MTADDKESERELRSFGRRRGRKPSDRQAALLRDYLPQVAFDAAEPESASTTWLEIGFGGGEHLLWQARHNPNVSLIGCEPYEDGVIKLLSAVEADGLKNVRVHMGDARDVLRSLAPGSVDRAFILFPDPWPKRKHRKRRLVNSSLLDLLARALKPGAELRVGTDIGDYARTMLEAFRGEPRFVWQAESPADWQLRPSDWAETRYEAKAAAAGRRSYYFRFLRA
jgi:tRNA (guanine-N7-)-methyltransferase